MEQPYYPLLLRQHDIPERLNFYLKKNKKTEQAALRELVRPRLKIAIVTETWPPEINGVALSLLQLCKGLQKLGHKILLIRPQQQQSCADFSPHSECLVKAQKIPKYKHLQFGWPQILKVRQAMESFAPDIVHVVTEGPLGLAAQQAAKIQKIPVSSGFHSSFQEFGRFFDLSYLVKSIQQYLTWFHNNTALTIVPSRDTEKALRAFGVTCPLRVVGRGVDTTAFHPRHRSAELRRQWNCDKNTRVMLYVGRLSPEKSIQVIVEAYFAIAPTERKNVRLVIVGDGPERQALEALNCDGSIIFTGNLHGQRLHQVYASADVLCFASTTETFGNVVLEAMASGLPVIAYDYACAHQHIKHNVTGWLSPFAQVVQFKQYIQQLPHLAQLRVMGEQARMDAEHIGWQHPVQQFEHALYQVAQPKIAP